MSTGRFKRWMPLVVGLAAGAVAFTLVRPFDDGGPMPSFECRSAVAERRQANLETLAPGDGRVVGVFPVTTVRRVAALRDEMVAQPAKAWWRDPGEVARRYMADRYPTADHRLASTKWSDAVTVVTEWRVAETTVELYLYDWGTQESPVWVVNSVGSRVVRITGGGSGTGSGKDHFGTHWSFFVGRPGTVHTTARLVDEDEPFYDEKKTSRRPGQLKFNARESAKTTCGVILTGTLVTKVGSVHVEQVTKGAARRQYSDARASGNGKYPVRPPPTAVPR